MANPTLSPEVMKLTAILLPAPTEIRLRDRLRSKAKVDTVSIHIRPTLVTTINPPTAADSPADPAEDRKQRHRVCPTIQTRRASE